MFEYTQVINSGERELVKNHTSQTEGKVMYPVLSSSNNFSQERSSHYRQQQQP